MGKLPGGKAVVASVGARVGAVEGAVLACSVETDVGSGVTMESRKSLKSTRF